MGGVCVQFIIYHVSGKVYERVSCSMQFNILSDDLHKNEGKPMDNKYRCKRDIRDFLTATIVPCLLKRCSSRSM